MNNRFGASMNHDTEVSAASASGISHEAASFECNICFELAQDPIVTLCGHLFCWPCLYKWLHFHAHSKECPVCKALVEEEKLVPLYGRGKVTADPRFKSIPDIDVPSRPTGPRPDTAPVPSEFANPNPWYTGGMPVGNTRFANYTFSAAIGGLFPYLNFQVHGFPHAMAYSPTTGFPSGYHNSFHGGPGIPQHMSQRHHIDFYLKALLIMIGALLVATLVLF